MKFNRKNVLKVIDERMQFIEARQQGLEEAAAELEVLKCKHIVYQLTVIYDEIKKMR